MLSPKFFLLQVLLLFVSGLFSQQNISVGIKLIADGFTGPVAMECPKDSSGRLFICEQTGKIIWRPVLSFKNT